MTDAPLDRLGAAQRDLTENGYAIIEGALAPDMLAAVRDALYRIARSERELGRAETYDVSKDGEGSQRVWNLVSRDPVFCALAEHELALGLVRFLIGWPASLSSSSANIIVTAEDNIIVHSDMAYMPEPWGGPQAINIGWCIDDFTAENGATLVVPGSHRLNRSYREEDGRAGLIPAEAPAGSILALDGRLWHSAAPNHSGKPRAAIFNPYTLPIYLPQENWFRSLDPQVRQYGSETLLTLLGFRPGLLGRINGRASSEE